MEQEIRVGVIGIGYWGKKVLREYYDISKENPNVKLVAVCDPLEQNLMYAKENFGVLNLFNDFNEILKLKDLDAVHIATPNHTHFEVAKLSLENGKHVLVEKPMTINSKEAYTLLELATKKNKAIQVGHIYRFNNAIAELEKLIENGALGKVFVAKVEWTDKYMPKTETNIIYDLLPHPYDILNRIFHEWPSNIIVRSKPYRTGKPGLEDWAVIIAEYPDGKTATIEISWITPGRKKRMISVEGSAASVVVEAVNQTMTIYGDETKEIPITANNTIKDEITHFIEKIRTGGMSYNSGYIGAKTVELLEKTQEGLLKKGSNPNRLVDVEYGKGTKIYDFVDLYKCKIGENCKIWPFTCIQEGVNIGNNVKIEPGVFIPSGVTIEDDVFIGPGVLFTNDKYPKSKGDWTVMKTEVRKGSSIGAGAVILPGIIIGEGAMVGAGSIVTKDVPPFTLVVGNPAKIIKRLD